MATLTVNTIDRSGEELALVAADVAGDEFANTGRQFLVVNNGSGSSVTVTITTPQTVDGLAVADRAVAVPAGELWAIGPFPTATYNDGDGNVAVAYSAVTSVTVGVFILSSS